MSVFVFLILVSKKLQFRKENSSYLCLHYVYQLNCIAFFAVFGHFRKSFILLPFLSMSGIGASNEI